MPASLLRDWSPPSDSRIKVDCDASVHESIQLFGFGYIVRDISESWIKGCNGTILMASVLRTKLFAIWRGLLLAWNCGSNPEDFGCSALEIGLIQRNAIRAADLLARQAVEDNLNYVEWLLPPAFVSNVVLADKHSPVLSS
ncbi:hypothetical protein PIB30_037909 [Stylosanthes scabra]|uniref:RNase H type-1 domain-containing protein n=1 Tax=Stylosanthes scabra TaxID=79078 RepID=A0ABU6RDZ6_9FABA|nr:hypothetical protein [Stylosanthes scabra]